MFEPLVYVFGGTNLITSNPYFQVREYEEKIDRLERTVEQQRREIDDLKGRVQSLDGTTSATDQRVAGLIEESEQRQNSTSRPWFCLSISLWWQNLTLNRNLLLHLDGNSA